MEFTPASRGRAKPITKAALRKMQKNFLASDALLAENLAKEAEEKAAIAEAMEDAINDL